MATQYYNHLTDRMEDLEPHMAKNLPKSKEEFFKRLQERKEGNIFPVELLEQRLRELREHNLKPSECYPTCGDEIIEGESHLSGVDLHIQADKIHVKDNRQFAFEDKGLPEIAGMDSGRTIYDRDFKEQWKELGKELKKEKVLVGTIYSDGKIEYANKDEEIRWNFSDDVEGIENAEVAYPNVGKKGKLFAGFLLVTFALVAVTVLYSWLSQ